VTVLALDLGTKTGWCMDEIAHGVWDLKPGRFEGGGMRFVRFRTMLETLGRIDQVVFEEVRAHKGVDAAHIYGGLMATLQAWCETFEIPYTATPVGTIKKYWAGRGNAGKPEMILAGIKRGFDVRDDNEMDAIALWHYWRDHGDKS
jgi:hypothetical protein